MMFFGRDSIGWWLVAFLVSGAGTANAEGEARDYRPWHIGIGGVVQDQPYVGVDTQTTGFPVIGYFGERLQVFGPRANYLLLGNETFSLKADAMVRFSSYEPEDSAALQGMEERDMTLDAGFSASAGGAWGELELGVLTDVLDRHSGQEVRLSYGYELASESLSVTPFTGLRWMSANLSDYYYGVRPGEATPTRPAYELSSTTSAFVGSTARYRLTERWSLFGVLAWERLDDAVRDSPIVEDDSSAIVLITLTRSL
jgi:MipA family protein